MGIDTIGAGTGPSSWGSLAMITRGITHVGLQSEEALSTITGGTINKVALLPRPSTFAQAEGRRRLFWAAYLLDRWSAVNTGWELALGDFGMLSSTIQILFSLLTSRSLSPRRLSTLAVPRRILAQQRENRPNFLCEVLLC